MAVSNTIKKAEEPKQETAVVEYESNGEMIKISPTTIRKYLVSGNGSVSDEEIMMFMSLCRYQHLNPFLKEVYLVKYSNSSPASIVTGKDTFTKRARRTKDYAGKKAGIIVQNPETGEITEREGTFYLPNEKIVGGWAKIFIKGYDEPEYVAVSFEEYAGRTKDGELNSNWRTRPGTMIRKCAVVAALRESFPDDFSGLYAPEEMGAAGDIVLNDGASEVVVESTVKDVEPEVIEAEAKEVVVDEPKKASRTTKAAKEDAPVEQAMNPPVVEDAVQQEFFS